jgi:hypothetical protein
MGTLTALAVLVTLVMVGLARMLVEEVAATAAACLVLGVCLAMSDPVPAVCLAMGDPVPSLATRLARRSWLKFAGWNSELCPANVPPRVRVRVRCATFAASC